MNFKLHLHVWNFVESFSAFPDMSVSTITDDAYRKLESIDFVENQDIIRGSTLIISKPLDLLSKKKGFIFFFFKSAPP